MSVAIKRIYEPAAKQDGYRVLVDRLWPRGIRKEDAQADMWLKEIAPSAALRKWFGHEPEKWETFVERYHAELKDSPALETLKALLKEHKKITLLYGARDEVHNNAQALLLLLKHKK